MLVCLCRQRKSRKSKRSEDEEKKVRGIIQVKPWLLEDNHRAYRSEMKPVKRSSLKLHEALCTVVFLLNVILWSWQTSLRRPRDGASDDPSSEEEDADEADLHRDRLFSSAPPKYAPALRNRLCSVPKNHILPQAHPQVSQSQIYRKRIYNTIVIIYSNITIMSSHSDKWSWHDNRHLSSATWSRASPAVGGLTPSLWYWWHVMGGASAGSWLRLYREQWQRGGGATQS